jgi:hypothetical protein
MHKHWPGFENKPHDVEWVHLLSSNTSHSDMGMGKHVHGIIIASLQRADFGMKRADDEQLSQWLITL